VFSVVDNPCEPGTNACSSQRTCLASPGGYVCTDCPSGWVNDGPDACADLDECASGADDCDANATCTNTDGGYTCACGPGYSGDGVFCETDACDIDNGGCAQRCADVGGQPVCGCYPGFRVGATVTACDAIGDVHVRNLGLAQFLGLDAVSAPGAPAFALRFQPEPRAVKLEQVPGSYDRFTFTLDVTPGTCADGVVRASCVDEYRMCAEYSSGFRWKAALRNALVGTPAGWDGPECAWLLDDAGAGTFRLDNAWVRATPSEYPIGGLDCWAPWDCVFGYTAGNDAFSIVQSCDGVVCHALDQCHTIGECDPATGRCSEPAEPSGTPCEDGLAATTGDTCFRGVCQNGDDDGDGVANDVDVCWGMDWLGDDDHDGFCLDEDNCALVSNPDQLNTDGDGIGDACDNCPGVLTNFISDQDDDGVGDACDPDYVPQGVGGFAPFQGSYHGRGPQRPSNDGFVPWCPQDPGANKYNSYRFACYPEEPYGGESCLEDRWWWHIGTRIQSQGIDGAVPDVVSNLLNAINEPVNNAPPTPCTTSGDCPAGVSCTQVDELGGYCVRDAVKDWVGRLDASSAFLSDVGSFSYEMSLLATADPDKVIHLDTGACVAHTHRIYGFRVVNTQTVPMTIWVGRTGYRTLSLWWTINPGEEIRFNAFDEHVALLATTAEAYRRCDPSLMTKTVATENLAANAHFRQIVSRELVRYTASAAFGGGSLTVYRDKEMFNMFDLAEYPNYFGVGFAPVAGACLEGPGPFHVIPIGTHLFDPSPDNSWFEAAGCIDGARPIKKTALDDETWCQGL